MRFLAVFVVHLAHPYYADGRCLDFQIEPTPPTQRLLRNHRCVLKPRPNGVQVLSAVNAQGDPLIPWQPGVTLTFHLRLQNPDFALFTDLSEITQTTAPRFTNADLSPVDDHLQLALGSSQAAATEGLVEPRLPTGVFAEVAIGATDTLLPSADGPSAFHLTFKAKQVRWTYYYVTDLSPSGEFQIVDADASPLVFTPENRTDLNQAPDPADAIAQALAAQYPELRRLRFVSDGLVSCRQAGRKQLHLYLNGNRVVGTLPNPSLRHSSTMEVDLNGTTQQQEVLFHIVKHITHAFPTTGG